MKSKTRKFSDVLIGEQFMFSGIAFTKTDMKNATATFPFDKIPVVDAIPTDEEVIENHF